MGARKFFESDESYEEYLLAEKQSALQWIDVLGRHTYSKIADKISKEIYWAEEAQAIKYEEDHFGGGGVGEQSL